MAIRDPPGRANLMSLGLIDTPLGHVLYCPVRVKTQGKRTCTRGSLESVPIVQRSICIEARPGPQRESTVPRISNCLGARRAEGRLPTNQTSEPLNEIPRATRIAPMGDSVVRERLESWYRRHAASFRRGPAIEVLVRVAGRRPGGWLAALWSERPAALT